MTVSNVSSAWTSNQTYVQPSWKQRARNYSALQSALQSGDLAGAQQAFAALQKDRSNSAQASNGNTSSSQNNQTSTDFQALQSALSAGNLAGAQQAFAALKQDVRGVGKTGHHHHHHAGAATSSTAAPGSTPASTLPGTTGSTLNVQA